LLLHKAAIGEKDESIAVKDAEITRLRTEVEALRELRPHGAGMYTKCDTKPRPVSEATLQCSRHEKAPPVDPLHGNDPEVRLNNWLPSLEQAAVWNNWSEEERLIQFTGHLCGRASQ